MMAASHGVRRVVGGAVMSRAVRVACVLSLITPIVTHAQESRPSRLVVDTVAVFNRSVDGDGNGTTDLVVDAIVSASLGRGFEAISWPIAQRLAVTGEWSQDVWIAALRYERPGAIGLRIEGGLLPSPLGLANLTARRAHLNPTISQPSSLFSPLPSLGSGQPRPNLLGAVYPFGGQITVSSARWDARAALIDTSPLRRRGVFADPKPPRFANLVIGGGITPFVGFRVGASVTHGGWQRAGERPTITTDQNATVVTVESEFSFAHTTLAGEWIRDAVDTSSGPRIASGWFVQGRQTLTPRWFVAGRVERIASPLVLAAGVRHQQLTSSEETIGYRLTPEFTVRAGHRARRSFGRPAYEHRFAVSVVWWKRWL